MKILESVELTFDWLDLSPDNITNHPLPTEERSGGVHVSGLIRDTAIKHKLFTPDDQRDESMPMCVLLGIGFEFVAARFYGAKEQFVWQPGEMVCDGIAMSPDGIGSVFSGPSEVRGLGCVHEFKATYKSMREKSPGKGQDGRAIVGDLKDVRKEWVWQSQIKSYVRALGYRHSYLHVGWVCGDYRFPITPVCARYLIEYEDKELRDNWSYLRS